MIQTHQYNVNVSSLIPKLSKYKNMDFISWILRFRLTDYIYIQKKRSKRKEPLHEKMTDLVHTADENMLCIMAELCWKSILPHSVPLIMKKCRGVRKKNDC